MKKFVSIALASAMIASMGVTAFAKNDYDYDVKDVRLYTANGMTHDNSAGGTVIPDELYFILSMTAADADANVPATKENPAFISDTGESGTVVSYDDIENIDDLKVNIKFTAGEEYVSDYYIDEIDDVNAGEYNGKYAVIVELNDNYTTKKQKIKGEITLKNKTKKLGDERDFSYSLDVDKLVVESGNNVYTTKLGTVNELQAEAEAYNTANNFTEGDDGFKTAASVAAEKAEAVKVGYTAVLVDGVYYVKELTQNIVNAIDECDFDDEDVYINLIEFAAAGYTVADFSADVENIELEDNNGFYFDVKASDQGKLNLSYDNVAIKSVVRMAPIDADLTFYNFYGYPEFDFTGKVTLTPEEDDVEYFVYSVAKDGSVSKVNAKLNDDGDAYEFKTRTLGCYVLSDMELDIDEDKETEAPVIDNAPVEKDEVVATPETGKVNPATGC
ncbi:MAG: hypothetical protein IKV41_01440 [Oscillospiraceae bacterium]|nr:hypothetical protein [Oscillospiraceae bacterium]